MAPSTILIWSKETGFVRITEGSGDNLLNEDLIEAIALGHDIGHTPIGHEGEYILDEISQRELNETFAHNIQSVRHLAFVEKNGKGLNLSIQVLDGIMCHNGEILSNTYIPEKKTKEEFLSLMETLFPEANVTDVAEVFGLSATS